MNDPLLDAQCLLWLQDVTPFKKLPVTSAVKRDFINNINFFWPHSHFCSSCLYGMLMRLRMVCSRNGPKGLAWDTKVLAQSKSLMSCCDSFWSGTSTPKIFLSLPWFVDYNCYHIQRVHPPNVRACLNGRCRRWSHSPKSKPAQRLPAGSRGPEGP